VKYTPKNRKENKKIQNRPHCHCHCYL